MRDRESSERVVGRVMSPLSSVTDLLSFWQLLQSSVPRVGLLVSSAASDSSSSAAPELSLQQNEVHRFLLIYIKPICSVLPLISLGVN